jgi:hypothetical protein
MEPRRGHPAPLLEQASRGDDAGEEAVGPVTARRDRTPDLGDLVIVLLAGSLAGLRDRLFADGFGDAAELVADLVEVADGYLARVA